MSLQSDSLSRCTSLWADPAPNSLTVCGLAGDAAATSQAAPARDAAEAAFNGDEVGDPIDGEAEVGRDLTALGGDEAPRLGAIPVVPGATLRLLEDARAAEAEVSEAGLPRHDLAGGVLLSPLA